MKQDLTKIHA